MSSNAQTVTPRTDIATPKSVSNPSWHDQRKRRIVGDVLSHQIGRAHV